MAEGKTRRDGPPAEYRPPTPMASYDRVHGDDVRGEFWFVPTVPLVMNVDDATFVWQCTNDVVVGATLNGKWIDGRIERP